MTESLDLVFELRLHAKFVDIDLVEYFEEFGYKLFFANVLVLTIAISCPRATVVNIMCCRAIAKLLVFIFGRDAGLTEATCEKLREGEFFVLPHNLIAFELGLAEVEKFFRDDRLVLAVVPVAALAWSFESAVVEGIIEDAVDATERQGFVSSRFEVEIMLEPVVYFASAPFLVGELLEHLFDDWCADGIDDNLAFLVHEPLI